MSILLKIAIFGILAKFDAIFRDEGVEILKKTGRYVKEHRFIFLKIETIVKTLLELFGINFNYRQFFMKIVDF